MGNQTDDREVCAVCQLTYAGNSTAHDQDIYGAVNTTIISLFVTSCQRDASKCKIQAEK